MTPGTRPLHISTGLLMILNRYLVGVLFCVKSPFLAYILKKKKIGL